MKKELYPGFFNERMADKLFEMISSSCEQTENIGKNLAAKLLGTEIIALFGGLGVGKTAFVRGLCKGLEVKNNVCSPTFAIVNEYKGKYNIYHFDMYRVKTMDDLYSTGYFDYINNGILIIEWSENIESVLPDNIIKLVISYGANENERILRFESVGELNSI